MEKVSKSRKLKLIMTQLVEVSGENYFWVTSDVKGGEKHF